MSTHRRRISAIQALIAGSPLASRPSYTPIYNEFNEVMSAGRIRRHDRKRLLQLLHSTRALDSSLQELVDYYGIGHGINRSLGGYLRRFSNHTRPGLTQLPNSLRTYYQNTIVDIRNQYLHEAGTYPMNDAEIRDLLAEMQDCLLNVITL
jgi:hypothetical protein